MTPRSSRKRSFFVRHRVPPMRHQPNDKSIREVKSRFHRAVEKALERGELPPRNHSWVRVYRALIDKMGPDGSWYPSHKAVAKAAGVSLRSAWGAINALEKAGIIRVQARYVYDAEKGKTVRTSNLYEVVTSVAEKAMACVAAVARKAKESAKRERAANAKSWAGQVLGDLNATHAHDPLLEIYKERNQPQMSISDWLDLLARSPSGLSAEEAGY